MVKVVDDVCCAAGAADEHLLASSAETVLLAQEPTTHTRALASPRASFWDPAECKEVAAYIRNQVFDPIDDSICPELLSSSDEDDDDDDSNYGQDDCPDLLSSSDEDDDESDEPRFGADAPAVYHSSANGSVGSCVSLLISRGVVHACADPSSALHTKSFVHMLRVQPKHVLTVLTSGSVVVDSGATIHATMDESFCFDVTACSVTIAGVGGTAFVVAGAAFCSSLLRGPAQSPSLVYTLPPSFQPLSSVNLPS
jgi:hypothetical protein